MLYVVVITPLGCVIDKKKKKVQRKDTRVSKPEVLLHHTNNGSNLSQQLHIDNNQEQMNGSRTNTNMTTLHMTVYFTL